ncbi:MAG: hypothetical protein JNG84_10660, partial [Archangium sp.]|nr:hypothetical protein [Archangium sp.]
MCTETRWVVVLVAVVSACAGRPPAGEKAPISADARGVTLAEDAPQWKYVELAGAQVAPRLAPLPLPGRVGLDPRRT